jgi:hypothetical protein
MKLTGDNRSTRGKTCPSATLSTTNPTWTDPGPNPRLRGDRPASNRLSHGTAWHRDAPHGFRLPAGTNLQRPNLLEGPHSLLFSGYREYFPPSVQPPRPEGDQLHLASRLIMRGDVPPLTHIFCATGSWPLEVSSQKDGYLTLNYKLWSSGMWRCIFRYIGTNFSENLFPTSILKIYYKSGSS